jgi:hypothetical protein
VQFVQFVLFSSVQHVFPPFCFSFFLAMPVEGPGQALPHATKDDKVVPHAFKNIERGQWVVFLKKGSHGARFSGLVSKVEKGKVTLTNTKEYTEDKNGNVKRQQNKGDVVFDVETVVGSWLIQKGGAKAKTPKERVQQRASGSRAERSKRPLDVDEGDEEDGDEEEEDEEGDDEPEGEEGIVDEDPSSEEEEKPKKQDKGKGRRKKSLAQEFFQEADSEEEDPHGRREPKRRRKAQGSQEDDDTLTNREVVRVNNGLEQYGVSIDSVGTHVKLCLRSNVHAKKQLAAALRLLLEVPNNLLRWHFFLRSEYIPAPASVVSTLRREAYKYKDYAEDLLRNIAKCRGCGVKQEPREPDYDPYSPPRDSSPSRSLRSNPRRNPVTGATGAPRPHQSPANRLLDLLTPPLEDLSTADVRNRYKLLRRELCRTEHEITQVRQGELPDASWEEPLESTRTTEELLAEMQSIPWFARQWERMEEAKHQWALEEAERERQEAERARQEDEAREAAEEADRLMRDRAEELERMKREQQRLQDELDALKKAKVRAAGSGNGGKMEVKEEEKEEEEEEEDEGQPGLQEEEIEETEEIDPETDPEPQPQAEDASTQGLKLQVASVRGYTKNGSAKVNPMFLQKQRQMEAQLQAKLDAKKKPDDDSGPGQGGGDAGLGSDVPGTA